MLGHESASCINIVCTREMDVHSSHFISHYNILGNRGNAYGRNTSLCRNRSSFTEGAAGNKDVEWRAPLPGIGEWRGGK